MLGRRKADLLALLGYAVLSAGFFGWPLLPHPGSVLVGSSQDPQLYVWSFAWWPHAIGHWLNPVISHAVYVPNGVNLTWTVSVPGLALVFSPLTELFGPVVSYDIAAMLMPALSAWTAYLLCRYLTRSVWASLIGGYLYGFSGSILREQLWGNLHVTALFLLPLVALLLVRFARGDLSSRGLIWRFGLVFAFQFWISTEFAFTVTFVLVLGLLLAFWLVSAVRLRIRAAVVPLVGGYALAGVLSAPLLIYALSGFVPESFEEGQNGGIDLVSFVVPARTFAIGGSSFASFTSRLPDGGAGAYLGLPTLAILALFGIRHWRTAGARFLLAALGLVTLIALGPELLIDSRRVVALPWEALSHLPGFSNAFAFRFSAYISLAAAVIVALWTATTKGLFFARPYVLPVLAVASIVPAIWQPFFHLKPQSVPFITDGLYKSCIPHNETVAIFPFGGAGNALLWQAESGFWFNLAGDGLEPFPEHGTPPNPFDASRFVWEVVFDGGTGRPTMDRVLSFAATHRVGRVLSLATGGYPDQAQMQQLGSTKLIGGMYVAPGCGQPSLETRNLASYVKNDPYTTVGSAPNIGYCVGTNYVELSEGLDPAGILKGARRAIFVAGQGLGCTPPPSGFVRHGFATPSLGVPANTYPLYTKT